MSPTREARNIWSRRKSSLSRMSLQISLQISPRTPGVLRLPEAAPGTVLGDHAGEARVHAGADKRVDVVMSDVYTGNK